MPTPEHDRDRLTASCAIDPRHSLQPPSAKEIPMLAALSIVVTEIKAPIGAADLAEVSERTPAAPTG